MIEELDNLSRYGSLTLMVLSMVFIAASGLFFGFTYYIMDVTNDAFLTTDCVIDNNTLVSSCQDLWDLALYPFLALKELLIWFSFFFIFALVLGMLMAGYRSGESPVLMGLFVAFVGGLTYGGIILSNMYRTMLENTVIRSIMVDFTVYNKIMLYFPWFCFFVGLFAVMLSLVNYQKSVLNTDKDINNF